ncbi:LysR family transcriptional regulator [Jannaschia pohangensis]|uniref:DNA-binding transcriptional regulator, LysR family n=1 Tax=Jannaschia pohangensis TaxID=390807 RepID=A0A1I3QXV7_9RHOB|nr:LysR family transcriptional regulator [Jannaschia pohangensis]SFJ37987.1 DNA-binding transcriptional regulator, LysR family [Jannaschia pohangensis]
MSSPSADLIIAFEAVVRLGSLSAAARALGRAQPTVRRQIEALEQTLGVRLFTRAENGMTPTAEALALMPMAEGIEAMARAFLRTAQGDIDRVSGVVRITCPQIFATYLMPAPLAELRRLHPDLTVELVAENRVENLMRRDADIAVRLALPDQEAIVARKVTARPVGVFVARDFTSICPDEADLHAHLAQTPFVWDDRARFLAVAAAQMGLTEPARIALHTDDQVTQIAAIAGGVGAGVCQCGIAARLDLRRIAPNWGMDLQVWIAAHEDQIALPRIRRSFDMMVAAFGADPTGVR